MCIEMLISRNKDDQQKIEYVQRWLKKALDDCRNLDYKC